MEKNISIADIVWSYITVDGKRDSDEVTRFISEVGPAFIKYEILVGQKSREESGAVIPA